MSTSVIITTILYYWFSHFATSICLFTALDKTSRNNLIAITYKKIVNILTLNYSSKYINPFAKQQDLIFKKLKTDQK